MTERLPPGTLCVVCQDLATGNHYSIPSCNGCKTFFRRAVVKNRKFTCMGNGNCSISKGGRCACRHCRFKKCLEVGMDRNSIQNDRDRIGYTKRTRKADKLLVSEKKQKFTSLLISSDDDESSVARDSPGRNESGADEQCSNSPLDYNPAHTPSSHTSQSPADSLLDRLTLLENNFTLLLSRGHIEPYGSLDHALASPSLFNRPIEVKMSDPIASPKPGKDKPNFPFWRSRIIVLYIDWAKTFSTFRNLPYSDKVALITNHASSYMVMCEAFRTPEHTENKILSAARATLCASDKLKKETCASPKPMCSASIKSEDPEQPNESQHSAANVLTTSAELDASQNGVIADKNLSGSKNSSESVPTKEERSGSDALTNGSRTKITLELKRSLLKDDTKRASSASGRLSAKNCASLGGVTDLTPVLTAMIDYIMKPFRRLKISITEFAVLQAIMFFDPDTDGLDSASQRNVIAEQKKFLVALYHYICAHYDGNDGDDRYAAILLCIPTIRKVAAKKNESLQIIDMFKIFELNPLLNETESGIRSVSSIFP